MGYQSNAQFIYETLKMEIINRNLVPEQRLVEEELARRFEVSRTPIRQVLQKLTVEGFVEFIPYRGAFVKRLSAEGLKDLFQVRMALERLAAELFCAFPLPEVVEKLKVNLIEAEKAMLNHDVTSYANLDQEFHNSIIIGCQNKEIHSMIDQLNQKTYIFRVRSLALPNQMKKSLTDHKEILNSLLSNNPIVAGEVAERHVKGVLDTFYDFLKLKTVFK